MNRTRRQAKITEIINSLDVETQEELTVLLKREGYEVTQATVSRDIREMGLIKAATDRGAYKYTDGVAERRLSLRQIALFKEAVVNIDSAENLIVIKTVSGGANSAAGLVDGIGEENIVGSIAGDDTVLIIVRQKEFVAELIDRLSKFLN
jgi:transcriptional regulator of arginine metabolism